MSNYSAEKQSNDFTEVKPPGTTPKITSIFDFSAEALGQLKLWLEQAGLAIPITSILGFSQFQAQTATQISAIEGRTSNTYGDLATVGPTLTGLPDGKYVVMFGSAAIGSSGVTSALMSIQVNSTTATDSDACQNASSDQVNISMAVVKTLSNAGNNTITAKYRSSDGVTNARFERRWLLALRYDNK